MLNVEKENDEDQRKVAEKEPKDDTIDNISNWYKKTEVVREMALGLMLEE